jgi:hypothetical protein
MNIKCTKYTNRCKNRYKNIQNRPNSYTIYQHLPLQDPPKFTEIGIFGLKIYHLATLAASGTRPASNFFKTLAHFHSQRDINGTLNICFPPGVKFSQRGKFGP